MNLLSPVENKLSLKHFQSIYSFVESAIVNMEAASTMLSKCSSWPGEVVYSCNLYPALWEAEVSGS